MMQSAFSAALYDSRESAYRLSIERRAGSCTWLACSRQQWRSNEVDNPYLSLTRLDDRYVEVKSVRC